ncbi:MAG TPA: HAMP domain-containing methyl-accepting chemotaxis protein [Methylophilaceae bacterium]
MLNLANVSVKNQLRLLTGVLLLLMLIMGAYALYNIKNSSSFVQHLNNRIGALEELKGVSDSINVGLIQTTSKVRNNQMQWGDGAKTIEASKTSLHQQWDKYRTEKMDAQEKALSDEVDASLQQADGAFDEVLRLMHTQDEKTLGDYMSGRFFPTIDPIIHNLDQLQQLQATKGQGVYQIVVMGGDNTLLLTIVMIAAALIAGIWLGQTITSGINKPLIFINQALARIADGDLTGNVEVRGTNEIGQILKSTNAMKQKLATLVQEINAGVSGVFDSATQLATSSKQVASSSTTQTEATASVAAAVEELTTSIEQSSSNATEAERRAKQSQEMSAKGEIEVQQAAAEMSQIAESVSQTASQMAVLGEEAQKIGSIVDAIKDVADQTNLLALNAAIEAARAGEQGRGFAVVADEVRKLAERTGKSAQEITRMVNTIQEYTAKASSSMEQGSERVSEGVARANTAGNSMHDINNSSVVVLDSVGEISSALSEQKSASIDIAKNVERIAQITEENSLAVSNVSSAAAHLEVLANGLKRSASRFKL